jgi:putative ABC transport system permease protein
VNGHEKLNNRLEEEIRFHIEQQIEKNVRAGMAPDDARRHAHLKFGGVARTVEYTRDQFRWARLEEWLRDLRVAIRMWRRTRGAAAVAILTLAIGIGANTAMFSILNALILHPLPFPEADRLITIWDSSDRNPRNEVSFANYADWKAQQTSFEKLGLYRWWTANITGDQTPERVQGFQLTAEILPALGLKPFLGRYFTEEENQANAQRVLLISHGLWQRRFGGRPDILGATVNVNDVPRQVIGILPPELNFPPGAELIAPMQITPDIAANRRFHTYYVVGRLKEGKSVAEANADMTTIAARLAKEYPDTNKGLTARVFPLASDVASSYANGIWLLMGSVGFVLLIACANLANLLLARGPGRVRELAVRISIGASRGRIVRQLVTESLVLSIAGGGLGIAIAALGVRTLRQATPADLLASVPGLATLSVDGPVLVFSSLLSILTGLVFGLLPALRTSTVDANSALRDASRPLGAAGGQRLRGFLVAAEVALALILVSGAGFTLHAFSRLVSMPTGFDSSNVISMGVTLPFARYTDGAAQSRFYETLLANARGVPGVQSVGFTSHIPLAQGNAAGGIVFEGRPAPDQAPQADYRVVSDGYFETIGARLAGGRAFAASDAAGSPRVVAVNEAFANRFFSDGKDAVGSRIAFTGDPEPRPWREIVAVVKDLRHRINEPPRPETYIPFTQAPQSTLFLVAKTREDAIGMAPSLRAAVTSIDPNQPVWAVRTLDEIKARAVAAFRATVAFILAFGVVALLLSAIGIFGVVSYLVSVRTQEIGLRMALGARATDVVRLIVSQGSPPLLAGFAIGGVGAFALGEVLAKAFPEIGTVDPMPIAATAAVLIVVSSLATWLPARRAAAIHPVDALRAD